MHRGETKDRASKEGGGLVPKGLSLGLDPLGQEEPPKRFKQKSSLLSQGHCVPDCGQLGGEWEKLATGRSVISEAAMAWNESQRRGWMGNMAFPGSLASSRTESRGWQTQACFQ